MAHVGNFCQSLSVSRYH